MDRVFLIFGLLLPLMFMSPKAFACRCSTPAVHTAFKNARVVFEGEAIDDRGGPACGPKKMLMRVDNTFKGLERKEVYVSVGEACVGCAASLVKGEKYIVFATGDTMNDLIAGGCAGTFNLKNEKNYPNSKDFITEIAKQMEMHEVNIAAQPENAHQLLIAEAEHLLYWHDDERAEIVLRKLVEHKSAKEWAGNELLNVLVRLKKPQEIWDFINYEPMSRGRHIFSDSDFPLSYAAFSLGKKMKEDFSLRLNKVQFNDLQQPGIKFRSPFFTNVVMNGGNLSGSYLLNANISESAFSETNFSGVLFGRAMILDTAFFKVDFSGSDLTGATISNGKLHGVNFSNAILSGIKLRGTKFSCDTIWPDGFDPIEAGAEPIVKCENPMWSKIKNSYSDFLKQFAPKLE